MKMLIATALLLLVFPPPTLAAHTDYNGDGYSDIPIVTAAAGGTLQWTLFEPHAGTSTPLFASYGRVGDRVIPGNWISDDDTSAALVVGPHGRRGNQAVWTSRYYEDNRSEDYAKGLGRPGDIIIAGGDFNGDGITDSLLFKRSTRKLGLRVNFFTSDYNSQALGVERVYISFGRNGSRIFFLKPDGVHDWFATLSGTSVIIKDPFHGTQRSLPMGAVPTQNLPKPVVQPDGTELLAFFSRSAGMTNVIFKNLVGATVETATLPGSGEFLVGNFTDDPGEEVAVRNGATFVFHNPLSGQTITMDGPAGGTAYDYINITSTPR